MAPDFFRFERALPRVLGGSRRAFGLLRASARAKTALSQGAAARFFLACRVFGLRGRLDATRRFGAWGTMDLLRRAMQPARRFHQHGCERYESGWRWRRRTVAEPPAEKACQHGNASTAVQLARAWQTNALTEHARLLHCGLQTQSQWGLQEGPQIVAILTVTGRYGCRALAADRGEWRWQ